MSHERVCLGRLLSSLATATRSAALVTNPRLLILDEATEGLAPMVREEIWTCLTRLRAGGQSILVVDKYVEKLIALADRHSIIQRGQVVWQGSSAALDADHGVWHRYLGIGKLRGQYTNSTAGECQKPDQTSRAQRVGAFGELSGDYSGLSSSQPRA